MGVLGGTSMGSHGRGQRPSLRNFWETNTQDSKADSSLSSHEAFRGMGGCDTDRVGWHVSEPTPGHCPTAHMASGVVTLPAAHKHALWQIPEICRLDRPHLLGIGRAIEIHAGAWALLRGSWGHWGIPGSLPTPSLGQGLACLPAPQAVQALYHRNARQSLHTILSHSV